MSLNEIILNNGVLMPFFFVGTNLPDKETLEKVVRHALSIGCRAFDTSLNYVSSAWLGEVLKNTLSEYGLSREDLFLQSKLDWNWMISNKVEESLQRNLESLGVEYLDAWIMHWPQPETYIESYKTMEVIYKQGKVRSIGVSNFLMRHWETLCSSGITITPQINQIELHPLRTCDELVSFCEEKGIATQSYSPLCKMIPAIKDNQLLCKLAKKYNCSLAQLIIAWHKGRKLVPINKSSKPKRLEENMKGMFIELSNEDAMAISSLNQNYKLIIESFACPGF